MIKRHDSHGVSWSWKMDSAVNWHNLKTPTVGFVKAYLLAVGVDEATVFLNRVEDIAKLYRVPAEKKNLLQYIREWTSTTGYHVTVPRDGGWYAVPIQELLRTDADEKWFRNVSVKSLEQSAPSDRWIQISAKENYTDTSVVALASFLEVHKVGLLVDEELKTRLINFRKIFLPLGDVTTKEETLRSLDIVIANSN